MKKVFNSIILALLIGSFLFAGVSCAEEQTAEDLRSKIKKIIERNAEVLDYIPSLRADFDEEGNVVKIEYTAEGVTTDLRDLDKATLKKLYNRLSNERIRSVTDKRMRELDRILAPVRQTPPDQSQK